MKQLYIKKQHWNKLKLYQTKYSSLNLKWLPKNWKTQLCWSSRNKTFKGIFYRVDNDYLMNSWASSWLPWPMLPPMLGSRDSIFIGEKGCWLLLALVTWISSSQRKHHSFLLPEEIKHIRIIISYITDVQFVNVIAYNLSDGLSPTDTLEVVGCEQDTVKPH